MTTNTVFAELKPRQGFQCVTESEQQYHLNSNVKINTLGIIKEHEEKQFYF